MLKVVSVSLGSPTREQEGRNGDQRATHLN
jgi:hypothetical protein